MLLLLLLVLRLPLLLLRACQSRTIAALSCAGISATSPKSSSASLPASGPSVTCGMWHAEYPASILSSLILSSLMRKHTETPACRHQGPPSPAPHSMQNIQLLILSILMRKSTQQRQLASIMALHHLRYNDATTVTFGQSPFDIQLRNEEMHTATPRSAQLKTSNSTLHINLVNTSTSIASL
jgi:hypothetical protein